MCLLGLKTICVFGWPFNRYQNQGGHLLILSWKGAGVLARGSRYTALCQIWGRARWERLLLTRLSTFVPPPPESRASLVSQPKPFPDERPQCFLLWSFPTRTVFLWFARPFSQRNVRQPSTESTEQVPPTLSLSPVHGQSTPSPTSSSQHTNTHNQGHVTTK
jgi:hypothetical protein